MRVEVFYRNPEEDGRVYRLLHSLKASGCPVRGMIILDVYIILKCQDFNEATAVRLLSDKIAQNVNCVSRDAPAYAADHFSWDMLVEVAYKPGVTDPLGLTAKKTIELEMGTGKTQNVSVRTARQYVITFSKQHTDRVAIAGELYNPLIQEAVIINRNQWLSGSRPPIEYKGTIPPTSRRVQTIPLAEQPDSVLMTVSKERLLALTLQEMQSIRTYYEREDVRSDRLKRGLPPAATDVELEMIAQTWSEHCKHKIFAAEIEYNDEEKSRVEYISSLFETYVKKTTAESGKEGKFLRSVFHDNSGVVQFHSDYCLCFKVETHNSPSALDPYGGAITGIVGVNRDILGTGKGAKPIFNTNVLCFGELDTPKEHIPPGLLHPKTIMHGVHQGIIDGGNQSGIPVVAGGFLFDESFTGKPLVFCGTGGVLPAEIRGEPSWIKHIDPGDRAVMVGGRIGKDGIHGATFSSQELSEESPTSAVQIGDPITQKKMADFLLEARDLGLYKGITDNGAGGLSSSLGEMALASGGVRVYLEKCPLKYSGLAPWEIFISESQERMSLAVSEDTLEDLLALSKKRDVEVTEIGVFTNTGSVELFYDTEAVGSVHLDFLHNGLPRMQLQAAWRSPRPQIRKYLPPSDKDASLKFLKEVLLAVLREPNVASKERWVRQYDHEVQGGSVVKPFCGEMMDGPSDGGVWKPHFNYKQGITVTHGICPRYGDIDTYHMAMNAVDEAFRAHVALGGNPETACALDNFCWPDPIESEQTPDGKYKCAQLVRACKGLYDACRAYGLPLISGKDSMKNDARMGERKVSIRPTLLISLMGLIPDIDHAMTTDFKCSGDPVYILGETKDELGGSIFEKCTQTSYPDVPKVTVEKAKERYKGLFEGIQRGFIRSCHDCSDGGFAIALIESAIGGNCGVEIDIDQIPVPQGNHMEIHTVLFSETPSRFVVSIDPKREAAFRELFPVSECARIGTVTEEQEICFSRGKHPLIRINMSYIREAWKS